MNKIARIIIVIVLITVVGAVIVLKQSKTSRPTERASRANSTAGAHEQDKNVKENKADSEPTALPRLVDLGASKCIPCKLMAPILEELKKEYAGRLEVEFIDVWENPDMAKKYGIKIIPTQIFFDASGKELFRHEGFMSKEDILGKWKELGVDLTK
ncbi:hypothetical protein ES707_13623 [subsurface metagenome]